MDNIITNIDLKELQELFVSKKFDEARDLLLTKKSEISSGLFHYNMGAVLGEQGNLPAARYHFELAKKEGFSHPALYKNLSIVKTKLGTKTQVINKNEYIIDLFSTLPSSTFIFSSLVLTILTVLVCKYLKASMKVMILVSFIVFTPTLYKSFYFDKKFSTAINLKEVELFQGPSKIYEVIDMVPAGNKLILSKSHDEWVFIEYPIEFSGWVNRDKIAYY